MLAMTQHPISATACDLHVMRPHGSIDIYYSCGYHHMLEVLSLIANKQLTCLLLMVCCAVDVIEPCCAVHQSHKVAHLHEAQIRAGAKGCMHMLCTQ